MGVFESSCVFPATIKDLEPVANDLCGHFEKLGYETHSEPRASGGWDVGITKSNLFKSACGLRTALKIEIVPKDEGVFVKAGIGIFGQQAIPMLISWFVFWPVLITQVWGIVAQSKLDDEAIRVVGESLDVHASSARFIHSNGKSASGAGYCRACGIQMPPESAFCPGCGAKVSV